MNCCYCNSPVGTKWRVESSRFNCNVCGRFFSLVNFEHTQGEFDEKRGHKIHPRYPDECKCPDCGAVENMYVRCESASNDSARLDKVAEELFKAAQWEYEVIELK